MRTRGRSHTSVQHVISSAGVTRRLLVRPGGWRWSASRGPGRQVLKAFGLCDRIRGANAPFWVVGLIQEHMIVRLVIVWLVLVEWPHEWFDNGMTQMMFSSSLAAWCDEANATSPFFTYMLRSLGVRFKATVLKLVKFHCSLKCSAHTQRCNRSLGS